MHQLFRSVVYDVCNCSMNLDRRASHEFMLGDACMAHNSTKVRRLRHFSVGHVPATTPTGNTLTRKYQLMHQKATIRKCCHLIEHFFEFIVCSSTSPLTTQHGTSIATRFHSRKVRALSPPTVYIRPFCLYMSHSPCTFIMTAMNKKIVWSYSFMTYISIQLSCSLMYASTV